MAVEVGAERVQEVDNADGSKGWQVVSEICNDGAAAVNVIVTQWPYDADGKKINPKQERAYTIPAGQCITVAFSVPHDRKPAKSYTDVYVNNGGQKGDLLDGEINPLTPVDVKKTTTGQGTSHRTLRFHAPLPQRIVEANGSGWVGEFSLDAPTGVPAGWIATPLDPVVGEPFTVMTEDRERHGALRVVTGPEVAEGTNVHLGLVQRVVGAPATPVNTLAQDVWLVADSTAPIIDVDTRVANPVARTIDVTGHAYDNVSGVGTYAIRWTADNGATWMESALFAPKEPNAEIDPEMEATIGPFCPGQTVRTKLVVSDGVGNTAVGTEQIVQF